MPERPTPAAFAERPRALTYDHLAPGDEGYWPVIGARPDELAPGDRLHFPGDELGDVVVEVERDTGRGWPCRLGYVTADGRRLSIGRMAEGFRLDRWGTSATLGRSVR